MSETLIAFIERMFVGPVWPASVLVCLLLAYTLVSLLGLFDLDLGGDAEVDKGGPNFDGGLLGGFGAMTVRWTNLDRLPLVLWMSVFTVAFWAVSYFLWYGFDVRRYEPTWIPSLLLCVRNVVIAVGVTKILTQPISGWFVPAPTYSPSTLIGQHCEVSTSQVDETFGQGRFKTDAAPLLLNIRTDGERFAKGSVVQIIAFDADRRIYKVTAASQEVTE